MRQLAVGMTFIVVFGLIGCGWLQPAPKTVTESAVNPGVMIQGYPVGGMSRNEVDMVLSQIARETNQGPVNACFSEEGQITGGQNGRAVNTLRTAEQVMAAPANTEAAVVYDAVAPNVSDADLSQARQLGAYATPILDSSPGRMTNLRLTAKLISNVALEAGQEFSFNTITGEPTEERGFRKAVIFGTDGRMEEGLGGGMCQVSSTLYNAVLAAGLPVTERHPHSQPVAYVPAGKDATTFTDKDFRFRNSLRQPVVIRAFVKDGKVHTDLWVLTR